jgi:hypothetical protein
VPKLLPKPKSFENFDQPKKLIDVIRTFGQGYWIFLWIWKKAIFKRRRVYLIKEEFDFY